MQKNFLLLLLTSCAVSAAERNQLELRSVVETMKLELAKQQQKKMFIIVGSQKDRIECAQKIADYLTGELDQNCHLLGIDTFLAPLQDYEKLSYEQERKIKGTLQFDDGFWFEKRFSDDPAHQKKFNQLLEVVMFQPYNKAIAAAAIHYSQAPFFIASYDPGISDSLKKDFYSSLGKSVKPVVIRVAEQPLESSVFYFGKRYDFVVTPESINAHTINQFIRLKKK